MGSSVLALVALTAVGSAVAQDCPSVFTKFGLQADNPDSLGYYIDFAEYETLTFPNATNDGPPYNSTVTSGACQCPTIGPPEPIPDLVVGSPGYCPCTPGTGSPPSHTTRPCRSPDPGPRAAEFGGVRAAGAGGWRGVGIAGHCPPSTPPWPRPGPGSGPRSRRRSRSGHPAPDLDHRRSGPR